MLKCTKTREVLSTTCNPNVISKCLSAPDATSLLSQKQAAKTNAVSVVMIHVFSTRKMVLVILQADPSNKSNILEKWFPLQGERGLSF